MSVKANTGECSIVRTHHVGSLMLRVILTCHLSVAVKTLSGHLGRGRLAWIVVVLVTKPALHVTPMSSASREASLSPNGPF